MHIIIICCYSSILKYCGIVTRIVFKICCYILWWVIWTENKNRVNLSTHQQKQTHGNQHNVAENIVWGNIQEDPCLFWYGTDVILLNMFQLKMVIMVIEVAICSMRWPFARTSQKITIAKSTSASRNNKCSKAFHEARKLDARTFFFYYVHNCDRQEMKRWEKIIQENGKWKQRTDDDRVRTDQSRSSWCYRVWQCQATNNGF